MPRNNRQRSNRGRNQGQNRNRSNLPWGEPSPKDPPSPGFHNPYNFVPAPSRAVLKAESPLADHGSAGHDSYKDGLWSGRIRVKMTTETPLLMIDAAKKDGSLGDEGHFTYDMRRDPANPEKPLIPRRALKGMLRSAYESVTNSRFSVFRGHSRRLGYHMESRKASKLVPAMIVTDTNGELMVRLMPGFSVMNNYGPRDPNHTGARDRALLYAASLPRYLRESRGNQTANVDPNICVYYEGTNNDLPENGETVDMIITRNPHERPKYDYWKVEKIWRSGSMPNDIEAGNNQRIVKGGVVFVSNQNFSKKYCERVFFSGGIYSQVFLEGSLSESLKSSWSDIIANYRNCHKEDEVKKRGKDFVDSRHPAFSPHQYDDSLTSLKAGTLCYAEVNVVGNQKRRRVSVKNLYPVMIARELYEDSPEGLLRDLDLLPAKERDELSPAERVFGWVSDGGEGKHKGQLRVHSVKSPEDAIREFEEPLPLAILGQPKPQQWRFYLGTDDTGTPVDRAPEDVGYKAGERWLRGRKVYPHHKKGLRDVYWDPDDNGKNKSHWRENFYRPIDGRFREYLQPPRPPKRNGNGQNKAIRDNQNRSIKSWIKPNEEFSFDIDVLNLSGFELGALLWLLNLHKEYYHRLGGAKPLGFGSVRLEMDWNETDLRTGVQWREFYRELARPEPQRATKADLEQQVKEFKSEVVKAYGSGNDGGDGGDGNGAFEEVCFIRAFLAAARGFDTGLPLHYPRVSGNANNAPNPDGENFKWFVANNHKKKESNDSKQWHEGYWLPLGPLADEKGLSYLKERWWK